MSGTEAAAATPVVEGPAIGPPGSPAAGMTALLRHARGSRGGVAGLVAIGAGQATVTIVLAFALTGVVVDLAGRGTVAPSTLILLAAAFAVRAGLTWAEQVLARRTASRVAAALRVRLLGAALRRGPAWTARFGPGRLTALVTGGLDALGPWFGGYLPSAVLAGLLPPLVLLVLARTDWPSALIALVTLPLVPLFGALVGLATSARAKQQWEDGARLAGHFLDAVQGLATLKLYGRAERQVAVVARMTERHRAATMRVLRVAFLSSAALDLVATLSVGLVAVEAGLRVAAGGLGLRPALLVILLAPEVYRPLREVGARFHASAEAIAVVAEVDAVLADESAPGRPVATGGAGGAGGADEPGVIASGLKARYPGAVTDALELPHLQVGAGELVALRGPSGAGKTTALRVLAGLHPLTAGDVWISGPKPLYLAQRPALPHARTVAEALLLDDERRDGEGRNGEHGPDDAELWSALSATGLDAELHRRPEGLDTPLGEHGEGLSSGQRRRLALARLLRQAGREPALLLLDEPTAHLDAATERHVVARLRAAADAGSAVLVVAHRPALLLAADRTTPLRDHEINNTAAAPGAAAESAAIDPDFMITDEGGRAGGVVPGWARRLGRRPAVAVLLGAGSWLAGTLLTGAAAWLLVKASGRPPVLSLSIAVVTVRGSAVARPLLRYLERLVSHEVGFARMAGWRAEVYAGLVVRPSGPVPRRRGELLTRIGQDVDLRVDGLLRGTLPAAAAGLTLAVATLAAAGVAPMAGAVLAAGLLLSALVAPALAARWATRADDQDDRARAELCDAVVETVDALEELAARGPSSLDLPRRRARQLAAVQARSALTAGAAAALSHLGLGAAVTAVAAVLATGSARPGPELAAAVLLGVLTLTEPVLALPDAAIARRRAAAARTRLAAPVIEQSVVPGGATNCLITAGKGVEVRGLTAGWGQSVLRDLDLTLPAGGRVAVLGTSGAGKSTLAAVLARRLAPSAGTVAGPERVGLVGDGLDHVFATTLRQNLLLARPEASDPELTDVLHQVELGSWLRNQPDGLDTWLGAGATTISGGEQRRLATARALLADPDLLVLDEPTEGLDEPTAQALMADLLPAGRGRSVILLAHRHEGLDRMDAVLELVGGRLRTVVPPVTPLARRIRPNQSRAATGSASGTNQ